MPSFLSGSFIKQEDQFFDASTTHPHQQPALQAGGSPYPYDQRTFPYRSQMNLTTASANPISVSLDEAFTKPTVHEKCAALTTALSSATLMELQSHYPSMVQKIFGFQGHAPGWQLERLHCQKHIIDSDAALGFLKPDGPFFSAIYQLMSTDLLIDFPFKLLPIATRKKIDSNIPPSDFLTARLVFSESAQGLLLDPLEYFFVLMAHKMTDHSTKHQGLYYRASDGQIETNKYCYPRLLLFYMDYFLPLGGTLPRMPSTVLSATTQRAQHTPNRTFSSPYQAASLRASGLGLLKSAQSQPARSPSAQHSDPLESKMAIASDSFVQIFTEFWLNQTSVDLISTNLDNLKMLSKSGRSLGLTIDLINRDEYRPSTDLMVQIRMMIRHMHEFCHMTQGFDKSHKGAVLPSNGQNPTTLMGYLKIKVLNTVRGPLYGFFKYCIRRWPLDASFRPFLEVWSVFLRPWRYATVQTQGNSTEQNRLDLNVWGQYIQENFPFYSVLLQDVLSRFSHLDLQHDHNAFMLTRVTRAFSAPGLMEYLKEIEKAWLRQQSSHSMSSMMDMSARREVYEMNANFKAILVELESDQSEYLPLFNRESINKVEDLLQEIVNITAEFRKPSSTAESHNSSFFDFIGLSDLSTMNMQTSGSSRVAESTSRSLIQSATQLSEMFQLQLPEAQVTRVEEIRSDNDQPEHIVKGDGTTELTELGRYQVLHGLRRFKEIEYRGDPALQPIRSFENTFLVRSLHQVAKRINARYADTFKQLYDRDDLMGSISRRILSVPHRTPSVPGAARSGQQQPRLTLRFLSSYQFILSSIILYFTLWLALGHSKTWLLGTAFLVVYIIFGGLLDLLTTSDKQK